MADDVDADAIRELLEANRALVIAIEEGRDPEPAKDAISAAVKKLNEPEKP